jgi:hypothetical protein
VGVIGLIREWLEFWVKRNWLKHIDRAIDKHNRLDRETKAQAYVVHELLKRYNELYPSDKIEVRRNEGE